MLTGDLIFTSRNGKYIKPAFVSNDDPELLQLAANLISICLKAEKNHIARNLLEADFADFKVLNSKAYPVNAMQKLLTDRIVFCQAGSPEDNRTLRKELLIKSAALLKNGNFQKYLEFTENNSCDPYCDLPEFDIVSKFQMLSVAELLNRYNVALVQALLFRAEKLTVTADSPEPEELRKMLKYLKFFRLLCDISKTPSGALKLEISGPLSLFGSTRKYALNLAAFFPAVIKLKEWSLRADIAGRSSTAVLKLDQTSGLVSHYNHFSSFVPEEIKLFHRIFNEKSTIWQITGKTPLFVAGKGHYIAPDISFCNRENQRTIHLELFHRWHSRQIESRMEQLERNSGLPIILGIDRAVCSEEYFEELSKKYPAAAGRCFRFRDFPGVDTVVRMLDKVSRKM